MMLKSRISGGQLAVALRGVINSALTEVDGGGVWEVFEGGLVARPDDLMAR